jgi:hypothetical protein
MQREEYFSLLKRQKIPSLEGTKKSLVSIGVFPFLKGKKIQEFCKKNFTVYTMPQLVRQRE